MNLSELTIHKLNDSDEKPFDLLLLADDELQAIEKYIYHSEVYVVRSSELTAPVGVMVLLPVDESTLEIKTLAVSPVLHNQGIGKLLISTAKTIAIDKCYKELHVGTADCAYKEINFYKRCGFESFDIKKDFFTENYTKPLFENDIQLRDMLMLRMVLSD